MKTALRTVLRHLASSGLAFLLASAAAAMAIGLARLHSQSGVDTVMRGYGVVVFAVMAVTAATAGVSLARANRATGRV